MPMNASRGAPRAMPTALASGLAALLDDRPLLAAMAAAPGGARRPRSVPPPLTPRAFSCRCGRPVFFPNSHCLACGTPLGYAPERRALLPLEPVPQAHGLWREAGAARGGLRWWRCTNLDSAAACNWLVAEGDGGGAGLCRCCRLTRTLPDLSGPGNAEGWRRFEGAKRRLVSSLIGLALPLRSKAEDPRGLAFDLLCAPPGAPPVVTGHADGVITIDVAEADDAEREARRGALAELYRTLLGHLRHETGHYYWQRLVERSGWLAPWRALFGDERQDYAASLERHYREGAPADWRARFVSAYAASHPWEDWAETWAHYLHWVDTLDTARSFGLDGERVELHYERFGPEVLEGAGGPGTAVPAEEGERFLRLLNGWMELTGVLNELSRSMGRADFYPFVLPAPAVRKLFFVHRVVGAAGRTP